MSSHRLEAHRGTRRRTSGRTRALVALAAVGVLATGMSVQGTFAFFTDTATLRTGDFTAGTLDITIDDRLAGPGAVNNPGTYTNTSFALANMVPGESMAYSFPIKNVGSTPLTYTVTGTGAGNLAVANGMQYSVTFGTTTTAAATNAGNAAANTRTGACGTAPGTASSDSNTAALIAGATATSYGTPVNRALAVGTQEQVCIVARFSSLAGNALQSQTGQPQTGTASFVFDAKQVGGS